MIFKKYFKRMKIHENETFKTKKTFKQGIWAYLST
jgi:hypothetical protein